jgi:hypothetical protein
MLATSLLAKAGVAEAELFIIAWAVDRYCYFHSLDLDDGLENVAEVQIMFQQDVIDGR